MAAAQTTGKPTYSAADIQAAFESIYGGLPASMMDKNGNLAGIYSDGAYSGAVFPTPGGGQVDASQLMYTYQQGQTIKQAQQAAQAAASGGTGTGAGSASGVAPAAFTGNYAPGATQSYLGSGTGASTSMANGNPVISSGSGSLYLPDGTALSASDTAQVMKLYNAYQGGDQTSGAALSQWASAKGFNSNTLNTAVTNMQQGIGPNAGPMPETTALGQMAQIDPASEALRNQVSQSYLAPLQQAQNPTAAQYQSYLDLYKQVDPAGYAQQVALGQGVSNQVGQASDIVKQAQNYVTQVTGQAPTSAQDALAKYQQLDPQGYASMQALGTSEDASLKQATDQLALGSQLDPVTARQVEQQTRAAQAARGNVYGTPQMAEEAMTTGQAGLALQAQRQAAAQSAQGGMQSYLQSGVTPGSVGESLYNQGLTNQQNAYGLQNSAMALQGSALSAQQGYLQSGQTLGQTAMNLYQQGQQNRANAQQSALSYLSSGQTPYQAGSAYVNQANADAASAAQGGPSYNPSSLGQSYGASQIPQYGLDIGAQSQNYFNSLNNAYANTAATQGKTSSQKAISAGAGALSGAAAGATAGSVVPVYGTAVGAIGGAIAGGLGGYFS